MSTPASRSEGDFFSGDRAASGQPDPDNEQRKKGLPGLLHRPALDVSGDGLMLWYACYSSLTASPAQHRADANNTTSLERPLEKRGLRAGGQLPGGGRRLTSKEVRSSGGALATTTCVGRCATAHASCPCTPRLRGRPRPRRSHPGVRPPRVGFRRFRTRGPSFPPSLRAYGGTRT